MNQLNGSVGIRHWFGIGAIPVVPLRPQTCCFTPRLWPIDCLPRKSEFRMKKEKKKKWVGFKRWSQHRATPASLHSSSLAHRSVSALRMSIWTQTCDFNQPHSLWVFHLEKRCFYLYVHHICLDYALWTLWPPAEDMAVTWWWNEHNEMPLLSTPPPPLPCPVLPLHRWAIFPLDGLSSNPQTLCTCVSISSVARRPFYRP